jgi:hypothetical protein
MNLTEMTRTERSLLLYLESCAVDNAARLLSERMNNEDRKILDHWVEEGFVASGRIIASHFNRDGTLWIRLSETAWELAHGERRARATRAWDKRSYTTTAEKQGKEVPEPIEAAGVTSLTPMLSPEQVEGLKRSAQEENPDG